MASQKTTIIIDGLTKTEDNVHSVNMKTAPNVNCAGDTTALAPNTSSPSPHHPASATSEWKGDNINIDKSNVPMHPRLAAALATDDR